jgi:ribosomal protein L33
VPDYYLICKKCNGYYKLEESEYAEGQNQRFGDQENVVFSGLNSCSVCGGDLILVEDINEYYRYPTDEYVTKKNKKNHLSKIVFILAALCIITSLILIPNSIFSNLLGFHNSITPAHSFLGSDSKGYVTKDVYSHYGLSSPKIAIITGMHPREISAKTIVPTAIKSYVSTHNVEIVNYVVNVTSSPNDFTIGRHNGEGLVAQYVVPDIKKSDYDLVIICHNHRKGYGSGYYIATPTMDTKSVNLAEAIHDILPDFNYYQRNTDEKAESTSINKVDSPIAATGTPVFVYEIPEGAGNSDVYSNSSRLIDACTNFLKG